MKLTVLENKIRKEKLKPLNDNILGKKVIAIDYDPKDEGLFSLYMDDGTQVHFSSVGDDLTFTTATVKKGE